MSTIDVAITHQQQYTIRVGHHLEEAFNQFCSNNFSGGKVIVVIDERVRKLHGEKVKSWCAACFSEAIFLEVPEGESSKSLSEWRRLVNAVLQVEVERGTPLVAVGGGVTGDLAGFVASSVFRGLPLIHVPTTLLAMVDSSIGGKTGINHGTGKNLIGAFYQPTAVFADLSFLETLAQPEWITGMAEILKYGAIQKPALVDELKKLALNQERESRKWKQVILQSMQIKAEIVEEDALEAGKRAFLNFGHTFGHALEKAAGYGYLAHGEAVFVGMLAAIHFSKKIGHPVDDVRFSPFITLYKQQMQALPRNIEELLEIMKTDKKVKNQTVRLVLLNEWGSPYIYNCKELSQLKASWQYALSQFH